ncbi:PhoU domain-containing protein [Ignisphaera sp. 4213-co]|uniref:PhoU domain-containing protein n=1 Tax=Ignisphaera cupida TaxID=3050454 RepID=A0ABD4Z8Y3_9CREN|nr:PhoU domain-containing protein [Ignisphaera sp. 4213-co]MDK6029028.1 PhoU domain-containing protein [Ignisphaera sp. 4213-co]
MSLTISELEKLRTILLHMSQNVKAIANLTRNMMKTEDLEVRKSLWKEIEELSLILDKIRREFVTEVLVFIARRQPLGRELLTAHALISIAYDVYRISRYCREIARIDSLLAPSSSIATVKSISNAFEEAMKALEAALNDLVEFAPKRVNIVSDVDENIDKEYQEVLKEITTSDVVSREKAVKALLMRHIERIVDHAQYIEQHLSEVV